MRLAKPEIYFGHRSLSSVHHRQVAGRQARLCMSTIDLPESGTGINLDCLNFNMSNVGKECTAANDLLKNSTLYREFQAEREEILRHKWIESEKAGHDIGFERALTDWIIKHRANWRKSRQAPQH